GLPAASLAVLAELLLRGPQTPGELRGRATRMSRIESLEELMNAIQPLIDRQYAERLPPAPGSRAERYVQRLCADLHPLDSPAASASAGDTGLTERVATLEGEIRHLRVQLEGLARKLGQSLEDEEAGGSH